MGRATLHEVHHLGCKSATVHTESAANTTLHAYLTYLHGYNTTHDGHNREEDEDVEGSCSIRTTRRPLLDAPSPSDPDIPRFTYCPASLFPSLWGGVCWYVS